MYQAKKIHYKAIFKQDNQSETIEYKVNGMIHHGDNVDIMFDVDDKTIHIRYGKNGVVLSQGDSQLRFEYQKEVWNQYHIHYGTVTLKTKLIKFEANEERLKMKYELHDQKELISTAYIYISMIPHMIIEG